MAERGRVGSEAIDTDADRYPSLEHVVAALLADENIPQTAIEKVEITCLASGEATYRVWAARAEEPEGGYLPA